jgi:hypothetical protein
MLIRLYRRIRSAALWGGLCCCLAAVAPAQQAVTLPGAPPASGDASLTGMVKDIGGTPVGEAALTLTGPDGFERKAVSDDDGNFRIDALPAGTFTLTLTSEGLQALTLSVTLAKEEQKVLPDMAMRLATANFQVDAISQVQLADQQIKQEETQRLLGILPNFFVTYDHNAAPLTTRQKYRLTARTLIDPVNLAIVGAIAGEQYAQNTLAGYGGGPAGFGKRLGANMANYTIGTTLGGAVFPAWFHQDPRYFYKGTGSVWSRAGYALATAVISKGDNGKWQPAYASVMASLAAGGASYLYYPASDKSGAGLFFSNTALSVALDGIGNVVQEFLLKHLTPGTPKVP